MNYYERHLGDYAKDTAHLTIIEHGAYCLLLDRYYSTEQGIPADQAHRVARARTKEEKAAVDAVLSEFFSLVDGIWRNGRADEEIVKAQSKIKAAQENGRRGGRPKSDKNKTQEKPSGFSVGSENGTETKAHQTPDTIHQTPKEKPNTPRFDARRHLVERGVSEQQADDWLTLRKAKRLPATLTALDGVEAEANKAGIELPKAIAECCLRGWGGFKAEWFMRDQTPAGKAQSRHGDFSSKDYRAGVNEDGSF